MADGDWPISVVAVERGHTLSKHAATRVEFKVTPGDFDLPMHLSVRVPSQLDDAALVAVARSYLAHRLEYLAERTASWKLSEAEAQALAPKKSGQ